MTRQTWTAFASALLFVAFAVLIAVLPVPFVAWSPGGSRDTLGTVTTTDAEGKPVTEPMITVRGIPTHPTTGRLDLTIVSGTTAGARLTLPEALFAYWMPSRDTLPREAVFPPGQSAEEVEVEETRQMDSAQDNAVVAALRAAGEPVTAMPVVSSVTIGGPADGLLEPGDLVVSVDRVPTPTAGSVGAQVRTHRPGESVVFEVLRNDAVSTVVVPTVSSPGGDATAVVGITVGTGYDYEPEIRFDLGQKIGGLSAGMVFALAIYDKITEGPLLDGRHVAGTGGITPDGVVVRIGGIQQKIAAAEDAGATVFLVPAPNCADLAGVRTDLELVRVGSLADSIEALSTLRSGGGTEALPRCP